MWKQPSHPKCSTSQGHMHSHMHLSRCVDCSKPLFTKTWKEKITGQLKARFPWPSKKRGGMHVGRYTVKQRCAGCQEPLRCNACSEAFFGNLSAEEIRVFIKALVLYAMKGLCVDCNQDFRFVHHELFNDDSRAPGATSVDPGKKQWGKRSELVIDGVISKPASVLTEIHALEEGPGDRKRGSGIGEAMEWRGGVVLGDWKREINDLLSNKFHLVLER